MSDIATMVMSTPSIDLSPLQRAGANLDEAVRFWQQHADDSPLKPHLRSAVIKSFELVYELSVQLLRRVLIERAAAANRVVDLSFNDLLRLGADAGLIADPVRWRDWRNLRNTTIHAYDVAKAEAMAARIPEFAADALRLRTALEAGGGC